LAHEADVDRTYVSALERSEYSATIDMVDKLAKALGVDASALLQRPLRSRQRKA
jgi:transcriptional regulator with XRE-family HTH domain